MGSSTEGLRLRTSRSRPPAVRDWSPTGVWLYQRASPDGAGAVGRGVAADILPTRIVGTAAHRETPLAMNAVVSTGLLAPGARSASSTLPRSSSPAAT